MKKLPFKLSIQANADIDEPAEMSVRGIIGASFDPETWTTQTTEDEVLNALSQIPKGKKINFTINSPGGDFGLALGCFNAVATRGEDVTTINAGYACSAASVLMLAGKKRISPVSCNWMIHCGSTTAAGNAEDFQKALNSLNSIDKVMASIYAKETGVGTPEEWLEKMKAETWYTGAEACDAKLGTSSEGATDSPEIEMTAESRKIFATFKRIPINLQPRFSVSAQAANPPPTNNNQQNNEMKKIIAALVALGFPCAESAGEDTVAATVNTAISGLKTERDGFKTQIEAISAARKTRITAAVDTAVTEKIIAEADKANLILVGSTTVEGEAVVLGQINALRDAKSLRPGRGVPPVPRGSGTGDGADSLEALLQEQQEAVSSNNTEALAAINIRLRKARGREPLFSTESEPLTRAKN